MENHYRPIWTRLLFPTSYLSGSWLEDVLDGSYLGKLKLDLVDGFFALKVKESKRQYLGFSLENEHCVLEYYEFICVLPQGITTAPFIFSRFTLAIKQSIIKNKFLTNKNVLFIYELRGIN